MTRDLDIIFLADEVPTCPGCGAKLNNHAGHSVPRPNDIVICLHCETPLLYDTLENGDLVVRLPATPQEVAEIDEIVGKILKSAHEMTDN